MLGHYKRVLMIGAHPDDIEFVMAGTLLQLQARGCDLTFVHQLPGEVVGLRKIHTDTLGCAVGLHRVAGDEAQRLDQDDIVAALRILPRFGNGKIA